jgi:CPA1 family monovalent cation:H+ antiporter
MFFIVSGEVKVELKPNPVKLATGDFFGEVGLLFQQRRTASVVALSYVELLELDAEDLLKVFDKEPEVRQRVMQEGERRLARGKSEN